MLVLTRKRGQAIKIGDDVIITVTEIRGKGSKSLVKLGITALRHKGVEEKKLSVKSLWKWTSLRTLPST